MELDIKSTTLKDIIYIKILPNLNIYSHFQVVSDKFRKHILRLSHCMVVLIILDTLSSTHLVCFQIKFSKYVTFMVTEKDS